LVAEGGFRLGSFLMAVLIGRRLGLEGFGAHSYVMALCSFAAVGADFGLRTLIVREGAARGIEASEFAAQAFWLRQALALFSVLVLWGAAHWLDADPALLVFGGIWVILFAAVDTLGGWGLALGEPGFEAGAAWIQRLGAVGFAAVLLLAGFGLRGVWFGQAIGVAAALVWLLGSRGLVKPRLCSRPDFRLWRRLLWSAFPLALASLAALGQTRLLWFLLEYEQGKAALGSLAAASKFFELGQAVPALAMGAAFPLLAEAAAKAPAAARSGATRLARLNFSVLVPIAVALAWRAAPLLALFGKGFADSQALLPGMMLALVLSGWNFLFNALLVALDDTWSAFVGPLVSVAISAVLGVAFIPRCGVVCCGWIQASGEAWMIVFYVWRLARKHRFSVGLGGLLPRAVLAAAAGSAAAVALPGLAGAFAGGISAVVACSVVGLVRREDLALLRSKGRAL
jgi:O-antigen/teichoic acid export membrane protein